MIALGRKTAKVRKGSKLVHIICCRFFVIFLVACNNCLSCAATGITGKVVGIADGDTITVLQNNRQFKIRFYGIDCPESAQAFGIKAKQFTSSLVFGKIVDVTVYDIDKYQRSVGVVRVDGLNVNEALLKNGYAWRYSKYCEAAFCDSWKSLEKQASNQDLGLWSEKNPMAPWDWRRSSQKERQIASYAEGKLKQQEAYKEEVSGGSLHGNTNSHVYHNAGCRWFDCKNCTRVFGNGDEARNAGYHACPKCGG